MRRNDQLHIELDRLQAMLPRWAARILHRARRPSAVRVRLPSAVLLMCGGVLGFLPILGFWMFPLGLALLAIDLPVLRPPLARILAFVNRKLAPVG
jgi:hypothetical protein